MTHPDPQVIASNLGRKAFARSAAPLLVDKPEVPAVWRPYVTADRYLRLHHLAVELTPLREYMPLTAEGLLRVAIDVLVVEVEDYGFVRTIVRRTGDSGAFYHAISFPPCADLFEDPEWQLFGKNAPKGLSHLYAHCFNGLTDAYDFGGPRPLQSLSVFESASFEDFPADHEMHSPQYEKNVVELFCSGSSGYFLLDLNRDQRESDDPEGILLFFKDDAEFSPHTRFWDYLDQWTAIALCDD